MSLIQPYMTVPQNDHAQLGFERLGLNVIERKVVNLLLKIHGPCSLQRKYDDTIEVRLPDPELLEQDGDKELYSRHLYVNVSKYVRQGHCNAAHCVKTGRHWNIDELLRMKPVEQRAHLKAPLKRELSFHDAVDRLVENSQGKRVPPSPGTVIPLDQLDEEHPAIRYVKSRNLDPEQLVEQFRAGYCTKANPDLKSCAIPGGLCRPPEGRLILFADRNGTQLGWQARRLELWIGEQLYFWDAWKNEWLPIGERTEDGFKVYDRYDGSLVGMREDDVLARKYFNAPGMRTSATLMGIDAAIKWRFRTGEPVLGLVEGALDAARLGPPFVAMMGLALKSEQAASLSGQGFKRVVFVCDQDGNPANAKQTRESMKVLKPYFEVQELHLPPGVKDPAELNDSQREQLLEKAGLLE